MLHAKKRNRNIATLDYKKMNPIIILKDKKMVQRVWINGEFQPPFIRVKLCKISGPRNVIGCSDEVL